MDTPQARFDETIMDFVDRLAGTDLATSDATTVVNNLATLSKIRPPEPITEPEPEPDLAPATRWGKVKAGVACAWDNETTRVFIKAAGAFAGVGVVVWSTVHRDHVLERNALAQANQRST